MAGFTGMSASLAGPVSVGPVRAIGSLIRLSIVVLVAVSQALMNQNCGPSEVVGATFSACGAVEASTLEPEKELHSARAEVAAVSRFSAR